MSTLRLWLIILLILLGLLSPTPWLNAQYNWTLLPESPQNGQKQDDVFFLDANRGWSVNGSGRIYHTTDGGESWALQWQRNGSYFRCVGFIDSLHGFVGNIGTNYFPGVTDVMPLYRTSDGGQTWAAVPPTQIQGPMPTGLCAIQVIDNQHVVAAGRVGGPATLIRSSDGGATWQSTSLASSIQMITDVYFSSPDTGYVFGGTNANVQFSRAKIIRTVDGGQTWTTVYTGERTFELCWKASFVGSVAYATLLNYAPNYPERYLAKTTNGGQSWQELPFGANGNKAFGVGFVNELVGWVGTDLGGYATTDGGLNWTPQNLGGYVNKIRLLPHAGGWVGYAIGQRIFKLTTAPTSTSEVPIGTSAELQASVFPNPAQREITLQYTLPEAQEVNIALYDMAGRRLDTLFTGRLPAGKQQHTYTFTHVMPGLLQVVIHTHHYFQTIPLSVLP